MSHKKTLLLDSGYQILRFIGERKLFKLLIKEKIEILDSWLDEVNWINGKIKHPSIVRLKNHVKRNYFNANFSRKALVKRDRSICQYCGKKLTASQITIDHVLPRVQGGITSFVNCVVSCEMCNNKKGPRTPEQANMILLRKPTHPSYTSHHYMADTEECWFDGWNDYLSS